MPERLFLANNISAAFLPLLHMLRLAFRITFLAPLFLGFVHPGHAQINPPGLVKCGSVTNWKALRADPLKMLRFQDDRRMIEKRVQQLSTKQAANLNREYEIPVVFHIVDPDPNRITDDNIETQLAILNNSFSGKNIDSINAPAFYNRRGHSNIKFVLARRSPDGCDTNGITRTVSNLAITSSSRHYIKYSALGGIDSWESYNCKYFNIWIGSIGRESNGSFFAGGFGTFPGGPEPLAEQGAVIDKITLPMIGNVFGITKGRALVHEAGHFFGLSHIWGDEAGCTTDDGITDTPLQDTNTIAGHIGLLVDACSPNLPGINYQNFMDYTGNNCTMFTNEQVLNMIASIESPERSMLINAANKALKPIQANQYFTMCTTPQFTTNDFYSIGIGKGGYVWAGTFRQGIYKYNGSSWEKYGDFTNNQVFDIKPDRSGGIWVAQAGYTSGGTTAVTGGINHFPDSSFTGTAYYGVIADGLPSRYTRGLFIDTTRYNGPSFNPLIWSAHMFNQTGGVNSNGGFGRGFNSGPPAFIKFREGLDIASQSASINAIGGNATEIWGATPLNFGKSQILIYDAITTAFLGAIDHENNPGVFPSANFDARAIYFDNNNRRWIGLFSGGIVVKENAGWYRMNSSNLLPAGTRINNNAITGDGSGNVFIGTTDGLLIYKGGPVTKDSSYKKYTTIHGLPSNNIKSICVDTLRKKLWIATDNGIVSWEPPCLASGSNNVPFVTIAHGELGDPATWCNGTVPPANGNIIVRHALIISTNTTLNSLRVEPGGVVTVAAGVLLSLLR